MQNNIVTVNPKSRFFAWIWEAMPVVLGSLYIALLAQISIPLNPVPVTLHTFAIFSLALFQGSKRSFWSLSLYLIAATIGLPVFPGAYSNPFWFIGSTAGYCFSFPFVAYLIGKCAEGKNPSITRLVLSLCAGQALIYGMGAAWLSVTIGWQQALAVGVFPFVIFDLVKLLASLSIKMAVRQR